MSILNTEEDEDLSYLFPCTPAPTQTVVNTRYAWLEQCHEFENAMNCVTPAPSTWAPEQELVEFELESIPVSAASEVSPDRANETSAPKEAKFDAFCFFSGSQMTPAPALCFTPFVFPQPLSPDPTPPTPPAAAPEEDVSIEKIMEEAIDDEPQDLADMIIELDRIVELYPPPPPPREVDTAVPETHDVKKRIRAPKRAVRRTTDLFTSRALTFEDGVCVYQYYCSIDGLGELCLRIDGVLCINVYYAPLTFTQRNCVFEQNDHGEHELKLETGIELFVDLMRDKDLYVAMKELVDELAMLDEWQTDSFKQHMLKMAQAYMSSKRLPRLPPKNKGSKKQQETVAYKPPVMIDHIPYELPNDKFPYVQPDGEYKNPENPEGFHDIEDITTFYMLPDGEVSVIVRWEPTMFLKHFDHYIPMTRSNTHIFYQSLEPLANVMDGGIEKLKHALEMERSKRGNHGTIIYRKPMMDKVVTALKLYESRSQIVPLPSPPKKRLRKA